jgi:DNA-binding NarL/FixJ family response regulator
VTGLFGLDIRETRSPPRETRKPEPGCPLRFPRWREGICAQHDGGVRPTLLIVDDQADFRGLARRLLTADGFDVVGEAADGPAAVAAARVLQPDVVLLGVQLPGFDGFEVTRRLRVGTDAAVVLTSVREREDYGDRVELCGADGFVRKVELSGAAVRAAATGSGG